MRREPITNEAEMAMEFKRCKPWIEAALKHSNGTYELPDILAGILEGEFRIWTAERSVLLTSIATYPRKKRLNIFLAGGDGKELRAMLPAVGRFARREECAGLELTGRRGWQRSWPRQEGFVIGGYQMIKEFGNGR